MSYEIIYGRQFIRTTRGIIPLVLSGSSNCTMFNHNREIRERSWGCMCGDSWLERPEEGLRQLAQTFFGGKGREEESFKIGSKWVNGSDALRYTLNGIRNSIPIEEICRLKPGQYLDCMLSHYGKDVFSTWDCELHCVIRTTVELEHWLDAARKRKTELANEGTYRYVNICIALQGISPLCIDHLATRHEPARPVVAKRNGSYIVSFDRNRITESKDIRKALEFASVKAAKKVLPASFGTYRFVSVLNKKKNQEKQFVLRITDGSLSGYYIQKLHARTLEYSPNPQTAKRFLTEETAMKWFQEHVGSARFNGIKNAGAVRLEIETC